ncbi:MAG TPA: GNAT family N-acetyltransferase [Cyclobacteriaceae bacterium]|jgi:GNAT superfamily N-acetyltransferase|nr:GNAT family N-acetyltransferase [Cyclobacteriaceae bacterium]
MDFAISDFKRLTDNYNILPFDCGDSEGEVDLNNFLLNNAKDYLKSLLAVTYLIEIDSITAAYYCVSNDRISIEDVESKNQWLKRFKSIRHDSKRFSSYPAVKVGRLAVHKNFQGNKFGTALLDFIKGWFITNNKTGCMYITVDAYKESLSFYERNDFLYLSNKDVGANTRLMYYDLTQLK